MAGPNDGLRGTAMAMSEAHVAGVAVDTRHWIGGRRVAVGRAPSPTSPRSTSSRSPRSPAAAQAEVAAAVQAAARRVRRLGGDPAGDRAAVLRAIADGIERRIEELAQVETRDNGALLRSHRRSVMPRVAHNFRFFADWLGRTGRRRPGDLRSP